MAFRTLQFDPPRFCVAAYPLHFNFTLSTYHALPSSSLASSLKFGCFYPKWTIWGIIGHVTWFIGNGTPNAFRYSFSGSSTAFEYCVVFKHHYSVLLLGSSRDGSNISPVMGVPSLCALMSLNTFLAFLSKS